MQGLVGLFTEVQTFSDLRVTYSSVAGCLGHGDRRGAAGAVVGGPGTPD